MWCCKGITAHGDGPDCDAEVACPDKHFGALWAGYKYEDADALALAAEGFMNLHQWDYYTEEGTLRPDAARAEGLIDAVLERAPSNALAHHLRIHIAEPARPGHA